MHRHTRRLRLKLWASQLRVGLDELEQRLDELDAGSARAQEERDILKSAHTDISAARANLTGLGVPDRELVRLGNAARLLRLILDRAELGERWELTPQGRRELVR